MVTITLELTYSQAAQVIALLNGSSEPVLEPTSPKPTLPDVVPVTPKEVPQEAPTVVKPTAGKTVKMASFGRSQLQVDTHATQSAERFNAKNEEELEKAQRREDREAAKASKEIAELEEKEIQAKVVLKAKEEVDAIRNANLTATSTPTNLKKPWAL